jgi:hypothetical protein
MYTRKPKDPVQERIEKRIAVKDAREDAKQRSITVAWSVNAAIALLPKREGFSSGEVVVEQTAREMLRLFDKLFEERSQDQARREEEYDNAKAAAELDAGNIEE